MIGYNVKQGIGAIPVVDGIETLTNEEKRGIMAVYEGKEARAEIEGKIRNVFLWAAINLASDVHFVGKSDRQKPDITITVRTSGGTLIHELYEGEHGSVFENKLFQITGTPQGASTPQILSTRFEMKIPKHFAEGVGLNTDKVAKTYDVNVRVEYTKTYDGFSFVCRLLDQQKTPSLEDLGFTGALLSEVKRVLNEPSGLFLVSGPTGSGKTTLLHAILEFMNDGTNAISTAEDPVEYQLRGGSVKQIQIGGDITFARALRSILRQDPDIILIGEIRDLETLEIAIKAAQTGHLVFATIHSNSAAETVGRVMGMFEMSDTPGAVQLGALQLADTLKFVIAQRLIPSYSGERHTRELTRNEKNWLAVNGIPEPSVFEEVVPVHKKRKVAVVEGMTINDEIKMAMRAVNCKNEEIYRIARNQPQYESLAAAGVRAVESKGCLLSDCMTSLDSNTDAKAYPSARLVEAREHNLSLSQVSDNIDNRLYSENSQIQKKVPSGNLVDSFLNTIGLEGVVERRKNKRSKEDDIYYQKKRKSLKEETESVVE